MADTPTSDSLRPGSIVGPWRIEGYAGRGTYGAVYRARRAGLPDSEPVALKMAIFAYDPRFIREAEVLSRVHHPSIPQLLAQGWWVAGPQATYPYLVLKWVKGLPLYEWARVHRPTVRQVFQVVAQVAWALDTLHRDRYLHRDVKGDNILVDAEGRAVLMDYGSSTWAGAPPLTERLMPPNTREYRSPESLRFEWANWRIKGARYEASPTDDLYALGVTTYRLVTQEYPPPGTEPEERKEQLHALPAKRLPVRSLNQRVVPELDALVERMLAEDPAARGRGRELAEAAESSAAQLGPEVDVLLSGSEQQEPESTPVPDRAVVPMAGVGQPAFQADPMPEQISADPQVSYRLLRPGLVGATWVMAMALLWWAGQRPPEETREVVQSVTPATEDAPDAGTSGLGDGGLTARVAPDEVHISAKAISLPMPPQPLPGQRRAPCRRRGEIEIHGGCWIPWLNISPPCGDEVYEWQGTCYEPSFERPRAPTSKKPQ
jgi:serine/threonine protein kinase